MKTRLSSKFWITLTLFSLIGQVAWVVENMYLNVFIYEMFRAQPEHISTMVSASAIAATLTTIFIGALSDRIGKRKLFMCGGYILWGISILGFALVRADIIEPLIPATVSVSTVGISLVIILDCVMTFFGSSANDAAFNAWLTDSTDESNRGSAEGINAMMPLIAILAVFGGFMLLPKEGNDAYWPTVFTIIGAVVLVIGISGFFIIEEPKLEPSETGYLRNIVHGFLPSTVKSNLPLYVSLACFIVFNISIQIFMPYLIIYYEKSLALGGTYVLIMAPAIVIASVVTALWGKVYDKKGYSFSGYISLACLMLGYIVLFIFKNTALVFVGSLLMMSGYLSGMAVFGARIRDLTPEGKSGMFQGVRIFSQVLVPGVIGPKIGAWILRDAEKIENSDGTFSFLPNQDIFLGALIAAVITVVLMHLLNSKKNKKSPELNKNLKTPFEDDKSSSWEEYPRPNLKRDSYLCLNGEWTLSSQLEGKTEELGKISVPFTPETRLSGINREKKEGEIYIYERDVEFAHDFNKGRIILHFGAVDQLCKVLVNGKLACEHTGGYLPFSCDITPYLADGKNRLRVEVTDELDIELAYGKQRKDRGGMWYTPTCGIWQTVWCESVPEKYIRGIRVTPHLDSVHLEVDADGGEKILTLNGKEYKFDGREIDVKVDDAINWTPENPHLYDFTLSYGDDKIESYFACRTVSIEERNGKSFICLNGNPILCHGLLDQGYYSDGIYLPATPAGYEFDILSMKKLGFNMLRKHIKIEPQLFYYYCDKFGMLVFQDMVNSGKYHYFVDTILPNVGIKSGITHKATEARAATFEREARESIDLLYNHPSVIYYTIFNEGWGQYEADRNYSELKAYDPTRVYDATSGWFWEKNSDVHSEHIYMRKLKLKARKGRPLVLSEFGGYCWKEMEHSFNLDNTYSYKNFNNVAEFEDAFISLYDDQVIPHIEREGLCALVYTQVSDVEDETNGLLTYDRQVLKVDKDKVKAMSDRLYKAFEKVSK